MLRHQAPLHANAEDRRLAAQVPALVVDLGERGQHVRVRRVLLPARQQHGGRRGGGGVRPCSAALSVSMGIGGGTQIEGTPPEIRTAMEGIISHQGCQRGRARAAWRRTAL